MPQLVTMGVSTYRLPNKHKRPQETTFMKMIRTSLKSAIALGVLSTGFIASTHTAQAQSANEARKWVKVCSKVGESDICNVQFNIVTPNNQLVTGVNLLQSKGKTTRRIFQVAVPSGRYIPEGIKVQIDKGKTNTLPYSICLPDRCLAEVQLSEGLVKALKGGGEIVLTSTNYRAQKNPVKVTLSGFTAAFDGPPLKRGEVAERNKKIEEGLKLKAKETADKLKAAQEAAKQSSN